VTSQRLTLIPREKVAPPADLVGAVRRRVENVHCGPTKDDKVLVGISVEGGTGSLIATGGHPFWADDEGQWVDATDLDVGDQLDASDHVRAANGQVLVVRTSSNRPPDRSGLQPHRRRRTHYEVGIGQDSALAHDACARTSAPIGRPAAIIRSAAPP
jgi:hypothetical protein